jgi:hypothetical protein
MGTEVELFESVEEAGEEWAAGMPNIKKQHKASSA